MLIQCNQCNTKFKLDDSKVKEKGVKVKCSKCGNIFVVKPPEKFIEDVKPLEKPIVEEKSKVNEEFWKESLFKEETFLKEEEFEKEKEFKKEEGLEKEEEFKIDEEIDFSQEFKDDRGNGLSFGEIDFGLEKEEKESDIDKWEGFSIPEKDSIEFSLENKEPKREEIKKNNIHEKKDIYEDKIFEDENEYKIEEKEQLGISTKYPRELTKKSKAKKSIILYVILFILFAIFIYAGFQYWTKGYIDISIIGDIPVIGKFLNINKEKSGKIDLKNLKGYFLYNKKAGDIFVIEGKALNNYSTTKNLLKVKGVIIDRGKRIIDKKEVYCGNIFSNKELEELSPEDIDSRLNNQLGESLSNLNIPPNNYIPFMIVFFKVPKDISEFNIDVINN